MKNIMILIAIITFGSCAISSKEQMKRYAYLKSFKSGKGAVTYFDTEHFRFKVQPEQYAKNIAKEHCPSGYSVTEKTQDHQMVATGSMAIGPLNTNWITLKFRCKD